MRHHGFVAIVLVGLACGGSGGPHGDADGGGAVCSDAWYRAVEAKVGTGDGQGHGPDLGSDEWKSTVEFRLGVRGRPDVPPRDGDAWCRYVEGLLP